MTTLPTHAPNDLVGPLDPIASEIDTRPFRILMLEDSPEDAELMTRELRQSGLAFEAQLVSSRETYSRAIEDFRPDLILADYRVPGFRGTEALVLARSTGHLVPVVIVSECLSDEAGLECIQLGAADYVLKHRLGRLSTVITNLLRAKREADLRTESDARFRQLWENAADAFFVCDASGRFLDVNGQACHALGYTREELLHLSVWDISVELDKEQRDRNRRRLSGERAVTVEGVHRRKDGTTFPVEVRIAAAPGYGEEAVMALARDVTERHRALEELRRSEEQYRSLVDHATQGIYRSDMSGRFLAVNPALVEMLGYGSADELMAVDIARDVYVDLAERSRMLDRHRNTGRVEEEVRWRRRDGGEIVVTLRGRAVSVGDDDMTEAFEVIVDDVTERRSIEAQLRQAQKMESVGQLTGGIAHDFNNVLAAILTNAQLLAMTRPSGLAEDGSELLRDIESAARRGADLIKRLMAFSRDDRLELEAVDPSEILKETVALLKHVLQRVSS